MIGTAQYRSLPLPSAPGTLTTDKDPTAGQRATHGPLHARSTLDTVPHDDPSSWRCQAYGGCLGGVAPCVRFCCGQARHPHHGGGNSEVDDIGKPFRPLWQSAHRRQRVRQSRRLGLECGRTSTGHHRSAPEHGAGGSQAASFAESTASGDVPGGAANAHGTGGPPRPPRTAAPHPAAGARCLTPSSTSSPGTTRAPAAPARALNLVAHPSRRGARWRARRSSFEARTYRLEALGPRR